MAQDRITISVLAAALILSIACTRSNEVTTSPSTPDSSTTTSSTPTTIPNTSSTTTAAEAVAPRVLVFSETAGFRHDSIPAGIAAIRSLGDEQDFDVMESEDSSVFESRELTNYDVVVFLSTTGDILPQPRRLRSRSLFDQEEDSSESTRPPTPSTTGSGTRDW